MPELPEVEIVRRGLARVMEGARIARVEVRRADLRAPFPSRFAGRLKGVRILRLSRRGKYLIADLDSRECLIAHLGMSGRFTIDGAPAQSEAFYFAEPTDPLHDHVVFHLEGAGGPCSITYNDPRRFGLMDLCDADRLASSAHFKEMGPEPLGEAFTVPDFNRRLKRGKAPIKSALLDQSVVAGVGNIYACEALFRARMSPRRRAGSVAGARGVRLHAAIREVLEEAIAAGGSTLRNFAGSDGARGAFQRRFSVYDRAGEPCTRCATPISRIVQGGRSTFFCAQCQR